MATTLSSRSAKVRLFYLKRSLSLRGSLSFNICREICSYFVEFSKELVQVTNHFLGFFNCCTSTMLRTVSLKNIKDKSYWHEQRYREPEEYLNSVWVLLGDDRVFYCGGSNN